MKHRYPVPPVIYTLVEKIPGTVLLETADPAAERPLSRLFLDPLETIAVHTPAQLPSLFTQIESAIRSGHMAAGYFAYECGAAFEPKTIQHVARLNASAADPLAWFGIYRKAYVFDHTTGEWLDGEPSALAEISSTFPEDTAEPIEAALPLALDPYTSEIERIHEWIRRGDVYQLNFTQSMRIAWPGSTAALYARLLANQPVAYAAFMHAAHNHRILSFSPELFFRVEDIGGSRRIVTQPMKGTAPRGRTNAEDTLIAEWLSNDEKNRSENVMIVDLLRNDLGRICEFGTVQVDHLFAVERLRTLWQMTSTVSGVLRENTGYEQILRALFPSGSVTGAPKVRAMQLLGELEDHPRGVYTGAIGFFAPQEAVFSVAIRTLELKGPKGCMGVGSGIVIDSDPRAEYDECCLKATFLTQHHESFQLIESLLWQDGYPLLALHLDRLADSASYFDFVFDRGAVEEALRGHAAQFSGSSPRKVRLLLDELGAITITSEIIAASTPPGPPLRVILATERADSRDPMLFHKTTHRPLYAHALYAAQQAGFDEVLFFNERGELTEGAINNLFVERNGILLTPPVACGLLAGVYRNHLLATRTNIREQLLTLDDLKDADAIYLANAVRGLRRAILSA